MELVFATNNKHKIEELQHLLKDNIHLKSLADIGCKEELEETGDTLAANAVQKARYIYNRYGVSCFADDTGLEIEALKGKPGVYSARYAGEEKNADKNIKKVLNEMQGVMNRKAIFKTVISLIFNNKEYLFEGLVKGSISTVKTGEKGFGYDPIFIPEGSDRSFAEMHLEEKNKISHRARAVKELTSFLNSLKA